MGTVTIISHRKTLAHISVLFMNSVTKGADDLSCKFYHRLHLHAQHIKHEPWQQSLVLEKGQHCRQELAVKTLNTALLTALPPSAFPDTGQATVGSSQSDHVTGLYLTSFLTGVKTQGYKAQRRELGQSCYVFKHHK